MEKGLQGERAGEGGPMRKAYCSVYYGGKERGLDQGRSCRELGQESSSEAGETARDWMEGGRD